MAVPAQALWSWQETPLTEADLGTKSLVDAKIFAPSVCTVAPGAAFCHPCAAVTALS